MFAGPGLPAGLVSGGGGGAGGLGGSQVGAASSASDSLADLTYSPILSPDPSLPGSPAPPGTCHVPCSLQSFALAYASASAWKSLTTCLPIHLLCTSRISLFREAWLDHPI